MKVLQPISLIFIFVLLTFASLSTYAQPTQPVKEGDRTLFIEITELDEDTYAELTKALKDNPMFQIKQVCIPAGVIMLTVPATNLKSLEENFIQFADIAKNKAELDNAHILAEYDEATFMNRCKQFRSGSPAPEK